MEIKNAIVNGKKQFRVSITISPRKSIEEPESPETNDDEVKEISKKFKVHKLAKKKAIDELRK